MTNTLLLTVTAVTVALTRLQFLNFTQSLDEPTVDLIKNCQLSWKPKVHQRSHNSA